MKPITTLEPKKFYAALYAVIDVGQDWINKVNNGKIFKTKPEFDETDTEETRARKTEEHNKTVLLEMFRRALIEYPDETDKLMRQLVVMDEGEEPTGIQLVNVAFRSIANKDVMGFLSSAIGLTAVISRL